MSIAVEVTLNKYSSVLPTWAVVGFWWVPTTLFIVWFWQVERTNSWVKLRFLEHPISYILMCLILIPVGWGITATMISKFRLSPQVQVASAPRQVVTPAQPQQLPAQPTPKTPQHEAPKALPAPRKSTPAPTAQVPIPSPPYPNPAAPTQTVNVDQGIGGIGSTFVNPTVNNFAPPARRIPASQKTEFVDCLSKHPGTVHITVMSGNAEAENLAQDWFDIFHSARWSITDNRIGYFMVFRGPTPVGAQITFHGSIKEDLTDLKYDHDSPGGAAAECIIGKVGTAFVSSKLIPTPTMTDDEVGVAIYPQR